MQASEGGNESLEAARRLLAEVAGRSLDEIAPNHRLVDDLLMDSLEYLDMAMMIEDVWGIVLDAPSLKDLVTVADVARLLPGDACTRLT